jgi:hypothetical protein
MKNAGPCCACKCEVWIPDALYEAALHSRGPNGIHYYCAYGHSQHYVQGESEETKLRRERDRLVQRLAEKDDEIARQRGLRESAENSARTLKGHVTRIKNRVGHGVCPCCSRTFGNLARHMATQHPTWTAEAAE